MMHSLTDPADISARPATIGAMQRYLVAMVAGAVLMLAVLGGALYSLKVVGRLPPPQFSNSLCIDEKIRSMQIAPPRDPSLLVVGSSVAWRHFNGDAAIALDPALKPFNAGFCGAKISEVEKIVGWLTDRLPSVRQVVLVASPFDFEGCTKSDPSQFNVKDADDFVFGGSPAIKYYARYFDPIALAGNARIIRQARNDITAPDPLVQDRFGDAPNQPARSRGLFYGAAELDDACFTALRRTARLLEQRGVAFDMTITPMHPEWTRQYARPAFARDFNTRLLGSLAGTAGRYHPTPSQPEPGAFYDAMHIRWSATPCFTASLMRAVGAPVDMALIDAADRQPSLGSISKLPRRCGA